jgi:hypothetical protein
MSQTETPMTPRRPNNRAGRTLLVKPSGASFNPSVFDAMTGLQTTHHTDKSNSYFLTFSTPQESLEGLKYLKKTCGQDVRVKFAHYRVFFKLDGLTDASDYNTVKMAHTALVCSTGANVLYYRLYRKNNTYLECGDFTIDTKEGFNSLMNSETGGLKVFSFEADGNTYSGTHFRYKKTDTMNRTNQQSQLATLDA